ncbi:MAG TPA: Ig-like domain-containing protein [Gemmatimonadales bacterium]|nr:Ig-like domain-containing protein [Gemmatimonadales bacterium]
MRRVAPWLFLLAAACRDPEPTAPRTPEPSVVTAVVVAPGSQTLYLGETSQLAVSVRDQRDSVLTGRTTAWLSANPGIATVSASGLVTAVTEGIAVITATVEGKSGIATVIVGGPRVSLDPGGHASAVIGPEGGVITARSSAGIAYRLDVPAGALMATETISMTPIAAIAKLPLSGGLAGGVELGPSGLRFARPATLRIQIAERPGPGLQLVGLSYEGDGRVLLPELLADSGTTAVLPISHFSGAAAGFGTTNDLQELLSLVGTSPGTGWSTLFRKQVLAVGFGPPPVNLAAVQQVFSTMLNALSLQIAATVSDDAALLRTISDFWYWFNGATGWFPDPEATFPSEIAAFDRAISGKIAAAIDGNLTVCRTQQSFGALANVLFWFEQADDLGLIGGPDFLISRDDLKAYIAQFCATVGAESILLPDPIDLGQPVELRTVFAVRFAGQSATTPAAFEMQVAYGPPVQAVAGFSDGAGLYTTQLTFTAPGPAQVHAFACLVLPGRTEATPDVCGNESVTRTVLDQPPPPPPPPPPPQGLTGTWELTILVHCSSGQSGSFVTTVTFSGGIATFSNVAALQFICVGGPFRLSGQFSGTASTDPNGVLLLSNAMLSQLTWSGSGVTGCTDAVLSFPGPISFVSGFNGFSAATDVPTLCNLGFRWTGFSLRQIS